MIVAVGYRGGPSKRAKKLLSGPLLVQSTICPKEGFSRFLIQDLKAYRDDKGAVAPVIADDEIRWRKDEDLLIGEVL